MKHYIIITFVLCFNLTGQAQIFKTINITTQGSLSTALTSSELNSITDLTITGNINALDFVTMRNNMPLLVNLDLAATNIKTYSGIDGTNGSNTTIYNSNTIPDLAFMGRNLKSIILPTSITSIGFGAFSYCGYLTTVTLPVGLIDIHDGAFAGCSALSNIEIPITVKRIYTQAFENCINLKEIRIPSSVLFIMEKSFLGCRAPVLVDESNPNFTSSDSVLYDKNKTRLLCSSVMKKGNWSIPSSVTTIDSYAFYCCNLLTSITIPNSVTRIKECTFAFCTELSSVSIPNTITSIGNSAFSFCSKLTSFSIPTSLNFIDIGTFSYSGLRTISIPSTITSIETNAFNNCNDLTTIYCYLSNPVWISSSAFSNSTKSNCILYIPTGSKQAYKNHFEWRNFNNIVEMTTDIKNITNQNLKIYPSPTSSSFQISGINGIGNILLLDTNGKLIFNKRVVEDEKILIETLPKGIYIVKIVSAEGLVERKIVKN